MVAMTMVAAKATRNVIVSDHVVGSALFRCPIGSSRNSSSVAKQMMDRAAISFIDRRKKFPERVTKVSPIAMMPTSAASRMIVFTLNQVRKSSVKMAPAMNTSRNNPTMAMTSGE